jgi:hypothetical protein
MFFTGRAAEGAHPQTLRQKDRLRRKIRLIPASSGLSSGTGFSHSGERQ